MSSDSNKWSHISPKPPNEWGESERNRYTEWAQSRIQIEGTKGAFIYGTIGNIGLALAHRFHAGFQAKDFRLKVFLAISFPIMGYAIYGDEAVLHYARYPPWAPQPGQFTRLA